MESERAPVIIGYDGSDEARGALLWALREGRFGRRLRVVAVLGHEPSPLPVLSRIPGPPDEVERVAKRIATQWDDDSRALDHLVDIEFVRGHPAEALAEFATREHAEMIIVGHRRNRSLAPFRDSVARDLICLATCPVVVVP
jgi:nucleotide-binding universal stress UspA family protein